VVIISLIEFFFKMVWNLGPVYSFMWREAPFIQEVLGIYTSLFLDTDELKMALWAWKVSVAFEKRAPDLGCLKTGKHLKVKSYKKYR